MEKRLALLPLLTLSIALAFAGGGPDYKLKIKSAVASNFQPGNDIYFSYDDDSTTGYHSDWNGGGFPITLTYNFFDSSQLDYLVYHPRTDGNPNGLFGQTEIWYAAAGHSEQFVKLMDYDFQYTTTPRRIDLPASLTGVVSIRFIVKSGYNNFASCSEMEFYTKAPPPVSHFYVAGNVGSLADASVQVPILGGTTNNYQGGYDLGLSFDNKFSTFYHSAWSGGGFPITLFYQLAPTDSLNSMIYYPRQDGSINGLFQRIHVAYSTAADPATVISLGDYDLQGSAQPTAITFSTTAIHPVDVMVTVLSGVNDFASCAEMQFFRKSPSFTPRVFADDICSKLQPSVRQSDIDTMTNAFYRNMAQHILDGTYQRDYRVQSYAPYPTIETTAASLKIFTWNSFENPTGVFFKKNEPVAIFVQATLPPHVELTIGNMASGHFEKASYLLRPGLNKIVPEIDGLGYVSYYDDNYRALSPVTINIAGGAVNGYFDVAKHTNADWVSLLDDTTYNTLDIVGRETSLSFNKNALRDYTPSDGVSLINLYDSIVHKEHELEGLIKYNRLPPNREFAGNTATDGWRTGGYPGSMFALDWGVDAVTSVPGVRAHIWGIAHEFGHANQISPDLLWLGMGEVTNNMYSLWCSRAFGIGNVRIPFETDPYDDGLGNTLAGGKMNTFLNEGIVKGKLYQTQEGGDPFTKLVPLYQLMLYYQLAGQGNAWYRPDWLMDLMEKARNTNSNGLPDGQLQLNFMRNVCDMVQEDLTEFFKKAGMLKAIDSAIDPTNSVRLTISQAACDSLVAYASKYPKPATPVLYYISSNSIDAYRQKAFITGTTGYGVTLDNNQLRIDHRQWKNVTAFETYRHDTLLSAAIYGSGSIDTNFTVLPLPDSAVRVFAVAWNGIKVQVFPRDVPLALTSVTLQASAQGAGAELHWNLIDETNVRSFEVQHSTGGADYTPLTTVASTGAKDYTYLDMKALVAGQPNYYRIRTIDQDGSGRFSNVAEVRTDRQLSGVFPVPFTTVLTVKLADATPVKQVRLLNSLGQAMYPAYVQGGNTITVYTGNIPGGVYVLELTDKDKHSSSVKVLRQ